MPRIKGWKKREYATRTLWYNPSGQYAIQMYDYSPGYGWMVEYGSYEHKKLSEDWVSIIKKFKTKEKALKHVYKIMRMI